ncbi:MAG: hypothetical protein JSS34_08760 [Proteobacteria bacterium]|nr:hypothetical protein [Pseudomonadota bacterium]
MRKTGGRNNQGRITVRHRGGGYKRAYRELEYREGQHVIHLNGQVTGIEYDPNRTAYLVACRAQVGGITRNYYEIAGGKTEPEIGKENTYTTLSTVAVGSSIYNVTLKPGKKSQIAKARGASCKIIKQEATTTVIRLPSSEIKRLNNKNLCQEGEVYGRPQEKLGTAGAHRRLGVRPRVRGVAMNPIDHPNGGRTHSLKVKNK